MKQALKSSLANATARARQTLKRQTLKRQTLKRKYDSEESRRRLLRAGIEVFSRDGYDAATTRKIAKVAGVNDSLIHRYFRNKLGLFFAILDQFHRHLSGIPPYPPGATLHEELTRFMNFRMEFSRKERKFLRLGITRAILDPKVREQMAGISENGIPGLVSRLEKLRAEGKVRKDVNLEHVSLMVSGVTFSMSMFTLIIFKMSPELADEVLVLAARILAEGLAPKEDRPL